MSKKLTPEQIQQAIFRYTSGETGESIAKDFGVTGTAIFNHLKRRGIPRRTSAEAWIPRKLSDAFCLECGNPMPNRKDKVSDVCRACWAKRKCPSCGQQTGLSEHVCNGIDARGLRFCLDCEKELRNQGSERWHPYCTVCMGKRSKDRERAKRRSLIEQFGSKCQRCGYDCCQSALHFHHVAGGVGKYEWLSSGRTSIQEVKHHPERFELVCANCHAEEHWPDISTPIEGE